MRSPDCFLSKMLRLQWHGWLRTFTDIAIVVAPLKVSLVSCTSIQIKNKSLSYAEMPVS